jgi:uncharacterized protein
VVTETASNQDRLFLGVGIAFPLAVGSDGSLLLSTYEDHVRQSILLILRTSQGERVMRPDFGTGLNAHVFISNSESSAALLKQDIEAALTRYEPRIDVLRINVAPDGDNPAVLLIDLLFRIRRTDTTFNLVYPFYLDRGPA